MSEVEADNSVIWRENSFRNQVWRSSWNSPWSSWYSFRDQVEGMELQPCQSNNDGQYTVKHLGYFNHILGCPSCISVTKECYQIGFLKVHWGASSLVPLAIVSCFGRPIWLHSWHFSPKTMQPRNSPGVVCNITETTNLTRNADLYAFWKEILI